MQKSAYGKLSIWSKALNAGVWFGYLAMLLTASFIQDFFDSTSWMAFSAAFYLICMLQLMLILLGLQHNRRALLAAKYMLAVLVLSYLWLWLQTWVPYSTYAQELLFGIDSSLTSSVSWFAPDLTWSVVPEQTQLLLMSELLVGSFFLLTLSLLTTQRRLNQLLMTLALAVLIHATVGIVAKYSDVFLMDTAQIDGHYSAARAWFINRNHFASFISLSMCGALALQYKLWMSSSDSRIGLVLLRQLASGQWLSLLCLVLGLVALLLSQSRAGFFGFCLAFTLVLMVSGGFKTILAQHKKALIGVFIGIGILTFYFGFELLSRVDFRVLSLGERGEQWATTLAVIKHEWLLGYGGNSYATVFQMVRGNEELRPLIYNQAHNEFLHIWLEQGLVGLILWSSVIALLLIRALHLLRIATSPVIRSAVIAGLVVVVAALMQSFFDFNLQILSIRLYFFVIMAMVFAAPSIKYRSSRKKRVRTEPRD
ncbi:O-antigen ligase family protein [Arenicella xantha]|uniref:O-antigen ligase-like membrane protein n=1 Tax=Arenicella xantha TaxID=644221 RepID=A0A395JHL4_9GAMM|nr:O-antigen ligase family protein [Arenicella xantha]RBP49163.1 O-antigen ligase-like membrane protein [Arenicella xantha]